jgi:hypothetical protein
MAKNKRHQKAEARHAQRREENRLSQVLDRRAFSADATAIGGVQLPEPHKIVIIEPISVEDGQILCFQPPLVEAFNLLKAKKLRDTGEPKRLSVHRSKRLEADGTYRPNSTAKALDALEDLALAVILSAAAIEAHVNGMIGRLPDEATVEIYRRKGGKVIALVREKEGMDRLPMSDKLNRVVPLVNGNESIKGTAAWQKYRRLFRIRDGLMHPKRIAVNDPKKPSPYGRLMLGEGSNAPEDAASVIDAIDPGALPEDLRADLGLS